MATLLSTGSVGQTERFAFWREAICESYVLLDCECDDPDLFDGEILLNRMSRLSTSFVKGSQQFVQRRKKDISRSSEASFLISLQLAGDGVISQCGREAYLQRGDFALYSSEDRYSLNLPSGFRQLVVQIPRAELLGRLPKADLLTGITVSSQSAIGGIINDSVLRLISAIDQSGDAVRQCMQDTIVDLFVMGLASLDAAKHQLSKPEQQILLRADGIIRSNLHNPDFNRHTLADRMGMSVRRLSEIYQNDKRSISSTIRDMRLNRIAADLKDSRYLRQTISDIAFRWGVVNQQSLARNFKDMFGTTPRDYRAGLNPRQAKQ